MQQKLKKLKKEELQKIILEMSEFLTKEQQIKLKMPIMELSEKTGVGEKDAVAHRKCPRYLWMKKWH